MSSNMSGSKPVMGKPEMKENVMSDFSWALRRMNAGAQVRRSSWQTGRYMTLNSLAGADSVPLYDILADDWELYLSDESED